MLRFSTAVTSKAVWSVSNCPDTSIQNILKRSDLSCSYKRLKLINPFISSSLGINSPSVSKAAEKMIHQNSDYGHPQSHTDSPLFALSRRRPPTIAAALMEKACESFASFTTETIMQNSSKIISGIPDEYIFQHTTNQKCWINDCMIMHEKVLFYSEFILAKVS